MGVTRPVGMCRLMAEHDSLPKSQVAWPLLHPAMLCCQVTVAAGKGAQRHHPSSTIWHENIRQAVHD